MTRSQKNQFISAIQEAIRAEFEARKSTAQEIVRAEVVFVLQEVFEPPLKVEPQEALAEPSEALLYRPDRDADFHLNATLCLIAMNVVLIVAVVWSVFY